MSPSLVGAAPWLLPALPTGIVVAGAVGLDVDKLEQEADRLLAHMANLTEGLSDSVDGSNEYRWLALAATLSAGVGYTIWANRSIRRPAHLPGGPGSVLSWRGEEGDEHGSRTR
jgi:hypothetical protein